MKYQKASCQLIMAFITRSRYPVHIVRLIKFSIIMLVSLKKNLDTSNTPSPKRRKLQPVTSHQRLVLINGCDGELKQMKTELD